MEHKEQKLAIVLDKIEQLASFLMPYLPLANAHNCDFIIQQHWEKMLPLDIANELLMLSDSELSLLPSGLLYLERNGDRTMDKSNQDIYSADGSANKVETSCSSSCCVQSMENGQCDPSVGHSSGKSLSAIPFIAGEDVPPQWDRSLTPCWSQNTLKDFVTSVISNTLPNLNVLSSVEDIRNNLALSSTADEVHVTVKHSMSVKKSYEIDIMTDLCHRLAKHFEVTEIVDIGSGRGYLGCHLALMHGHRVLGIDSSPRNTGSAAERTRRLRKQWHCLTKGKHNTVSSLNVDRRTTAETTKNASKLHESSLSETTSRPLQKTPASASLHTPITLFVSPETDLKGLVLEWQQSFDIDTLPVPSQDHLVNTSEVLSCDRSVALPQSHRLMLTGLHTCGDLSPTVLRLSVATPACSVACQVGCCYNMLTERFLRSPYESSEEPCCTGDPGFPLCNFLQNCRYQLGRNARMLACQSPERTADAFKLPTPGIYWRSLLQAIFLDVNGSVREDWRVGRILSKFNSFNDYARNAVKLVGLQAELSDDLLDSYMMKHAADERRNTAFFQLKMVLGPCVESLILLDRLAYLLEQDTIADAHLVQIFDVVTSPRCYAIVAIKAPLQQSGAAVTVS